MSANLFLASAPRSGSTQLAHWLNSHPEIALSAVKEPNFFSHRIFNDRSDGGRALNDVDPEKPLRGRPGQYQFAIFNNRSAYDRLFSERDETWKLDASTTYLSTPGCALKIVQFNPAAKVVILTRNPIERAISHYRLARRTGQTQASLAWELAAELSNRTPISQRFLIRPGMYREGIAEFCDAFGHDQVLQLSFEVMIADPVATMDNIAGFLKIDPKGFDLSVKAQNRSTRPRFDWLNAQFSGSEIKAYLRRRLPRPVKKLAKKFWFTDGQVGVTAAEVIALRTAIEATV